MCWPRSYVSTLVRYNAVLDPETISKLCPNRT